MSETTQELQSNTGGITPAIPSRNNLYAHTAKHAYAAIDFLIKTMNNERVQASVRASCANKIIDKCLPDLKATELTGEDSGPIQIVIVKDSQAKDATNE